MVSTKRIQILSVIVLVKGIILSLLGLLHFVATYFEYESIKDLMPPEMARSYTVWFFGVGVYILFLGLIDLVSYKGIKQMMFWAWRISTLTSVFCFITGLFGMIGFKWEPSPPYLIFLAGIVYLVLLIINIKDFKNNE